MMRKIATLGFVFCACLLAWEAPSTGTEMVALRVSPAMAREPASLRIGATIEPDERNRALEFAVRSSGYTTSSEVPLDGINARRVWETEIRDVPHGEYDVTATIIGTGGRRGTASRVAVVVR